MEHYRIGKNTLTERALEGLQKDLKISMKRKKKFGKTSEMMLK
jgi:ribosomal protein L10